MNQKVTGICRQIKLAAARIESSFSTADEINRFENPGDLVNEQDEATTEAIGLFMSQALDELGHLQDLTLALTGELLPATADETDGEEENLDGEGSVFAEGDLTDEVTPPDADKDTGKQD